MTEIGAAGNAVVLERTLDAPADLVWQMWTIPEHFKRWYGPDGATIAVAELDVRVGGARRVCMEVRTPDGPRRMWFVGEHLEVVANRRLVYSESMAGEDGEADHGMAHPPTEVRVELEDVGGRTRMVMTHVGVPEDSPGAMGWTMAFARLAAYLEAPPTA